MDKENKEALFIRTVEVTRTDEFNPDPKVTIFSRPIEGNPGWFRQWTTGGDAREVFIDADSDVVKALGKLVVAK